MTIRPHEGRSLHESKEVLIASRRVLNVKSAPSILPSVAATAVRIFDDVQEFDLRRRIGAFVRCALPFEEGMGCGKQGASAMPLTAGTKLDTYEILGLIGAGGDKGGSPRPRCRAETRLDRAH